MNGIENSKPWRFRAWLLGCVLATTGVFVFTLVWSSTSEFWDIGAFSSLIFGLPLSLLTVAALTVVSLAASWFVLRSSLRTETQRLLLLMPWILATLLWIGLAGVSALPRSRFRSVVANPVPTGVRDIKVAGLNSFLSRRWLLAFRIEATQIADIARNHSLARTNYYDLQQMIDRDVFLKRVAWARNVGCDSNALFYYRVEPGLPSSWTCLVVDTNSSRAWFLSGYQN